MEQYEGSISIKGMPKRSSLQLNKFKHKIKAFEVQNNSNNITRTSEFPNVSTADKSNSSCQVTKCYPKRQFSQQRVVFIPSCNLKDAQPNNQ